jgi:hypothetical protein
VSKAPVVVTTTTACGDLRRSFQLGQWFRQDSMKNAPSVVYRSAGGGIIDA